MSHDAEHLFPAFGRVNDDWPRSRHAMEQRAIFTRYNTFTRTRVLHQVCLRMKVPDGVWLTLH